MTHLLRVNSAWTALGGRFEAIGLLLLAAVSAAQANNIRVTNVGLTRQDTVTKTANVTFNLAWENSWRDGDYRDAAWVFVKFRAPGSNNWEHAILSTNSATHHAASNGAISAVSDGMGVFICGATNFAGTANYCQNKLRWNYGSNLYDFAEGALVDVSVHAIEMVYIPEGPFYLGSGGSENGRFYKYTDGTQTTNIYLVSSTNAITVGTNIGNLYYTNLGGDVGDGFGPISNTFPNGYAAFYCMKYEISQGQYAEFLNKLTTAQDTARYPNYYSQSRYTIGGTPLHRRADAPDRACNYLSWANVIAYADWAALRPMTELEFEKACRGTNQPAPNEYAWGNTNCVKLTNEYGVAGSGTETPQPTNANCNQYGGLGLAVRVGIFATTNSTRPLSGSGCYGVMELSGNMYERTVSVGTNTGRAFTGVHGNGLLTAGGDADVPGWPSGSTASGVGVRGGAFYDDAFGAAACVSDRRYAASVSFVTRSDRYSTAGGRAVRSAP